MGYKDNNNNGIFIKIRGTQDEDVDGEEQGEQAHNPDAPSLTQLMEVLGEIQLSLGHLNSRFNSMDKHLDSLGAQVAPIDHKVSLGASTEDLHGDPA